MQLNREKMNGGYKDVWGYSKDDLRWYTEWPEIKPLYDGHINYAGKLDVLSMKPEVLDDIIDAFCSILRGEPELEEISNELFPEMKQIKANYGQTQVGFNPDRLWEEGEAHIIP